jgi:hypothetical protein
MGIYKLRKPRSEVELGLIAIGFFIAIGFVLVSIGLSIGSGFARV